MKNSSISMTRKAYQDIKHMILIGELAPGQIVNEAPIQAILHMGRTPVHEALLRLSQEGLVHIIPRKGIQIGKISEKQIRDIYEARLLLEPFYLKKYADRLENSWLSSIKDSFEQLSKDKRPDGQEEAFRCVCLDNEFHSTIILASGNEYIIRLANHYLDQLSPIRIATTLHSGRFAKSCREHVQIIRALLNKDISKASSLLKGHLEASLQEAVANLEPKS